MKQEFEKQTNKKKSEELITTAKQAAKNVAAPATREVILKYKECCGCGCSDIKVKRTVPYDSPLKNGDRIEKFEANDKQV